MKMHLLFSTLSVTLFHFFCEASSFNIRPMSEFTHSAPNIVRGTLHNVHVENTITSDGGKAIFTYANVAVKETLKGDQHAANIAVRKLGGTKDGVTLEIPASPEFREGEDTVLFLSDPTEDRSYEVLGLEMGKFGLEEKSGQTILTGGLLAYSQPNSDHDGHHHEVLGDFSENQKVWSLQDLRTVIRNQGAAPLSSPSNTKPLASSTPVSASAPTASATAQPVTQINETTSNTTETSKPRIPVWLVGFFVGVVAFLIFRKKK